MLEIQHLYLCCWIVTEQGIYQMQYQLVFLISKVAKQYVKLKINE